MSKEKAKEVNAEVMEENNQEDEESSFYYFFSQGCGWCKKSEPIVDELNKEGKYGEILKLDLADPDNQALNKELQEEYNVQCGTPWFINEATGKGFCGFREKDIVEKWLAGEDIPEPPRPKSPMPRPPFHGATGKEEADWKKEYKKWRKENDHMPQDKMKSADELLKMPRPKSEPPRPPMGAQATDEKLDEWGKEYQKWVDENGHLPNLQPADQIVNRLKQQRDNQAGGGANLNPDQNARLQRVEQKLDKLIAHLGVK